MFSGSVYGGVIDDTFGDVFDRKGEGVGLHCPSWDYYILVDMKEKTIKVYKEKNREILGTHKIIKETEIYIMGEDKTTSINIFIDRHIYMEDVVRVDYRKKGEDGKKGENRYTRCIVGEKVF